MNCTGCGAKLDPAFSFCPRCGCGQTRICAACGGACKPEYSFCPNCGATLAGPASADARRAASPDAPPELDRRHVTVLFADVSGFTAIAERVDPEDVRAFQSDLFETMAQSVARFDGFTEKFVGDAVMAVFGAPVAHEDDPERALGAALDMVARCEALNERWAGRLGAPVGLHAGVHTGQVVAGRFGSPAGAEYAVTGDTVNTAARLLAAAKGVVLVSEATCALTRHRFAFGPREEIVARGKAAPLVVRPLIGMLERPRSARGLAAQGLATRMIGRADELEQLVATFNRMKRGRAQAASVVGEAGIGKSRLIAEFLARLARDGSLADVAVRRVACASLGEPTYGVFGALFRDAYNVGRGDPLDVMQRKLAQGLRELGAKDELFGDVAPILNYVLGVRESRPVDVEPEQLKKQIYLVAHTLLERRVQQQPVLILVEDIHWADAASVELLRDVADAMHQKPLMLLVSHRPETPPPLFARAAQSVIRLAPLSGVDSEALVHGLFGAIDDGCASQLVDFVTGQAGGNPYFVEEIARGLISQGNLVKRDDRWMCPHDLEAGQTPPTLNALLLSRIDKLPPAARQTVQDASIIGIEFEDGLLREVSANPAGLAGALKTLTDADILEKNESDAVAHRYRFKHALAREAVYQNLLVARRAELHARVGEALERGVAGRAARLDELEALAHHWSLSPDRARGARYLVATGDWARTLFANEDAIRHYERALKTLAETGEASELEQAGRESLADLLGVVGRREQARAHYDIVFRRFDKAGDRAGAARIDRKIGCLKWEAGDRDAARAHFDAGLARLVDDGDRLERAQLYREMGLLAFRSGDNATAIEWAQGALAEAAACEESPDAARAKEIANTRAHAFNTLGISLARLGRVEEAMDYMKRSVDLAESHDLPQAVCRGCANLGVLYGSTDPKLGIATCRRGLEAAKRSGDLGFQSRLYANLAVAFCGLSDRCDDEGVDAARRAIDLDRRLGCLDHLAAPLIVLAQIHQCHGDRESAFASYGEALQIAEQVGEPQLLFPCYDGLATLYLDSGDRPRAELYLKKAQDVCDRAGLEPDALMVLPFLA